MNRLQYWLLNGVSMGVAALIALEIHAVHEMDDASRRAHEAQVPLLQAQQDAPQIQRLIQRTAVGATRDPALRDLLAKYGVSVRPLPAEASAPEAPPVSTAASSSP